MKGKKLVIGGVFLAATVFTATIAVYNVWSVLNVSELPPGDLAPRGLLALKAVTYDYTKIVRYGSVGLFLSFLNSAGLGELNALKALPVILFTITIVGVTYLAWLLTRKVILASVAGIVAALFPTFYGLVLTGDYDLLTALSFAQLSLIFTLHFIQSHRPHLVAASMVTAAIAILADITTFPILAVPLLVWFIWLWKIRDVESLNGILWIMPFTFCLGTLMLPFKKAGETLVMRERLLGQVIHSSELLIALLVIVGIVGMVSLSLSSRKLIPILASWVATPLIFTLFINNYYILFAVPALIGLSTHPLIRTKGFAKLARQDEEFLIEIQLEKLLSTAMVALVIISTVFAYPSQVQAYTAANALKEDEIKVLKNMGPRLHELVSEGQLVAAPPRIASWLGAFGGVEVVTPVTDDDWWSLDAITSTTFRLVNPYIMLDEWQPLSSTRTPFIYSYDGRIYAKILHIDDGTNRMRVVHSGIVWQEDLYGMELIDYKWSETAESITLVLHLWKKGFNATKTITLLKDKPQVIISYTIVLNRGVELIDMSLPVYIEGRHKIENSSYNDGVRLKMPHADLLITYKEPATQPKLVYSPVQDFVCANFTAKNGTMIASLNITVLDAKRSSQKVHYTSLFDELREKPIRYLVLYNAPEDLLFLRNKVEKPVGLLEVIDSFNRVLLNHKGTNYIEAPANAEVVEERVGNDSRYIKYRTAGLIIEKEICRDVKEDSIVLGYSIKPWKEDTRLVSFTMSLWVDWGRVVLSQESTQQSLKISTDAGTVLLEVLKGNPTYLGIGTDPEYGQMRAQVQFALSPNEDRVEILIKCDGRIKLDYIPTSRPFMSDADILSIGVYRGLFRQICKDEAVVVYEIVRP